MTEDGGLPSPTVPSSSLRPKDLDGGVDEISTGDSCGNWRRGGESEGDEKETREPPVPDSRFLSIRDAGREALCGGNVLGLDNSTFLPPRKEGDERAMDGKMEGGAYALP